MSVLKTSGLVLPSEVRAGLIRDAQDGSAVARLSAAEPFAFGETEFVTVNGTPKAEFVGESEDKSSDGVSFDSFKAKPRKAQTTVRFSQEVMWADEDYQLGVLAELATLAGEAMARAIDLGILHAVNPLTGAALGGSPAKVAGTSLKVTAAGDAVAEIDDAVELLVGDDDARGVVPTGIALAPSYAHQLRKARDTNGHRMYPEISLNPRELGAFDGLSAAVSDTVSAGYEVAGGTGVKALVGDFQRGIRWGVAKHMPVHVIQYGDPDGGGDLQRKNEIALRVETAYVWYVDPAKFAAITGEDPLDP